MRLITSLLICLGLSLGSAVNLLIPRHNCGDYFTYSTEEGGRRGYIGIFTAPKTGVYHITWAAAFVCHGNRNLHMESMMPYPSREGAARNIYNGQRAQAFVRFVNITTELPKLVHLEVNGETLCQNSGYDSPSTRATVRFNMNIFVIREKKPCAQNATAIST
ncbi:uncharacterized protein [Drosophila kikkawai]|uniref:Serine protease gd N-terminal domain-containing protein n=1 Tax=Drosophila kikkawai TaxID=30033 RepID=A0A6P4I437_DROKI|nr:uncharacterized protein LOC108075699 [Drosophila kikkawai]